MTEHVARHGVCLYRKAKGLGRILYPWVLVTAGVSAAFATHRRMNTQVLWARIVLYSGLGGLLFYWSFLEDFGFSSRAIQLGVSAMRQGSEKESSTFSSPYELWSDWLRNGPGGLHRDSPQYLRWILFSSALGASSAPATLEEAKKEVSGSLEALSKAQLGGSAEHHVVGMVLAQVIRRGSHGLLWLATSLYLFAKGLLAFLDFFYQGALGLAWHGWLALGCVLLPSVLWVKTHKPLVSWIEGILFLSALPFLYGLWGAIGFELFTQAYALALERPEALWHKTWHWLRAYEGEISWKRDFWALLADVSPHLYTILSTVWYAATALMLQLGALLVLALFLVAAVVWELVVPFLTWAVCRKFLAHMLPWWEGRTVEGGLPNPRLPSPFGEKRAPVFSSQSTQSSSSRQSRACSLPAHESRSNSDVP